MLVKQAWKTPFSCSQIFAQIIIAYNDSYKTLWELKLKSYLHFVTSASDFHQTVRIICTYSLFNNWEAQPPDHHNEPLKALTGQQLVK